MHSTERAGGTPIASRSCARNNTIALTGLLTSTHFTHTPVSQYSKVPYLTMTTPANFKTMFQGMGWDADNAKELVQTHGIKTLVQLSRVDDQRSRSIVKAIRSPGGNAVGLMVTEGAEHGLKFAAIIVRDYKRIDRTLTCGEIKDLFNDEDSYELHSTQLSLEAKWDNGPGESFFKPLTEANTRSGWKPFYEKFKQNLSLVRGPSTGVPLTYLLRDLLVAKLQADDAQSEYADFDSQLVQRFPIMQAAAIAAAGTDAKKLEELEVAGPSKKRGPVNTDNTILFNFVQTMVDPVSWATHIEPAVKHKDGRLAVRLLAKNLQTSNEMDLECQQNLQTVSKLTYEKDSSHWSFDKFTLAHKRSHNIQNKLFSDHGYRNFEEREKVTWFLDGIKNSEFNPVILSINLDAGVDGARNNFEKANLLIKNYKMIMDSQTTNRRKISQISQGDGSGRGRGGGGGRGRGGGRGGRGGGGGGGRSPSTTGGAWRFKHKTTVGKVDAAKDDQGGWKSKSIWLGHHDKEAKLQTHITKTECDKEEYNKLEPLEKRKLALNRGNKGPPRAVSVVTQESETSSLTATVTGMASTVSELVKLSAANARAVSEMTAAFKTATDEQSDNDSLFGGSEDEAPAKQNRKKIKRRGR